MYICAYVHPRVCVYGYKLVSACRYVRAYMYMRACVRVSVRLVRCVYVYVRDYSYVLLLTSNVGVHAFAYANRPTQMLDCRCNKAEVREKSNGHTYTYTQTHARTCMHI